MMPFSCQGLHNWSDPFYERVKIARATKFPLTRLHLIQKCSACGETKEVWIQTPLHRESARIQRFPVEQDAQEAP